MANPFGRRNLLDCPARFRSRSHFVFCAGEVGAGFTRVDVYSVDEDAVVYGAHEKFCHAFDTTENSLHSSTWSG